MAELLLENISSLVTNGTLRASQEADVLLQKLGPRHHEPPLTVVLLSIYATIFVTGVFGNLFTCVVITRTSYMRTTTNYYLLSLAISDLVLLIIGR